MAMILIQKCTITLKYKVCPLKPGKVRNNLKDLKEHLSHSLNLNPKLNSKIRS